MDESSALYRPKFRDDVAISERPESDHTVGIAKDPATGNFYRLSEAELFIARQCDGETPLDVIRRRTELETGLTLKPEMLESFVASLDKQGLLDRGTRARSHNARTSRWNGGLFSLRLSLVDPSRILDRWNNSVRFFFTPTFAVASALLILLSVATAVVNWDEIVRDMKLLVSVHALPMFVVVTFLVISVHEFAHAFTCKRFGGNVREMGFMLMYLQPALYCNVSDAWFFREKWKRLLVGFAGPYIELFVWALAVVAWRITAGGTLVNDAALMVIAGSGVKTLFNFNPLIKYDGYYLLSDALDLPNLRKRSLRYVGTLAKRLFGFDAAIDEKATAREKRYFLAYGLTATVGTSVFIVYAAMLAGDLFVHGNEILGAGLATFLGVRFRRRMHRMFGRRHRSEPEETPGGKQQERQRKNPVAYRRYVWIALASLVLVWMFFGSMELRVGGPFVVLPVHNMDVRSEIDGLIQEIHVTEGDEVKGGDVIAKLSDREYRSELNKVMAQIEQTRSKLRMQLVGPTPEEVQLARTIVEKAKDRLKYAHIRADRNAQLLEKNLLSQMEYETTQELASAAENDVAEAERRLAMLLRGPRKEEIEGTRAEMLRLQAEQVFLEGQLRRVEVRSPVDGVVATPARALMELRGQTVAKGQLIAKVYDLDKLTVEIPVSEREISDVRIGCAVAFKTRAFPGRTFEGVVTSIATTVQSSTSTSSSSSSSSSGTLPTLSLTGSGDRTILVTTQIDNTSRLLKPGMTGEAKVYCGERRLISLLMRRVQRTVEVELWSWW